MSASVPPRESTGPAGVPPGRRRWSGPAPAKVNLFLRVLAREESGYHQIETLFQALELSDEVELELMGAPEEIGLVVEGVPADALGPPENNLAVRAARLLLDAVGEHTPGEAAPGLRIRLVKRIPHGAGLGGGSSDAATVLRGLNELLGRPLDASRLVTLGGRLGADVAFFLCGSPLALAWGRGDRLLPLPPLPAADVVLALPGARIATPDAYARLARWRTGQGLGAAPARAMGVAPWSSWEAMAGEAINDFGAALHEAYPELAAIRNGLHQAGARPALLSGSGSAVFGVFPEGGGSSDDVPTAEGVRVIRTRTRTGTLGDRIDRAPDGDGGGAGRSP